MSRRAPRPKPRVGAWIAVAAAVVLAAAAAAKFGGREDAPRKDLPETETSEPPPRAAPPRTEDERLRRLLDLVLAGDTDTALWARERLLEAGEPARRIVIEVAQATLRSNVAFVEHAFDVILVDPRPADVPLALEALDSADPQVVRRALVVLGRVADAHVREAIPAIARTASQSWPIPRVAMEVLAAVGGDDAITELERIAMAPATDAERGAIRDEALAHLGVIGGERARAILRRELDAAGDDSRLVEASNGLLRMGDAAPRARLREMLRLARDERALVLLARAADEAAFAELEARLRAPLESEDRRREAVGLLSTFPFAQRAPLLRVAAAAPMPRSVRADAWVQLVEDGTQSELDDLVRLLRSSGPDAREDRVVATLALARVTAPSVTPALLAAEAAQRDDLEVRAMILRALMLSGAPDGAATVVGAMAADPSPHGKPDALAYELALTLSKAPATFRTAAGPFVLAALRADAGPGGPAGPSARHNLIIAARHCCGAEAAPMLEPFLVHDDRHCREAAAEALGDAPGPTTLAALRNAWWRRQDALTRSAIQRALQRAELAVPVR